MRLIDARAAYLSMENSQWWESSDRQIAEEIIRKCKTVDAEPIRRGRWIEDWDGTDWAYYHCSDCGATGKRDYAYCPHCGAKMSEG